MPPTGERSIAASREAVWVALSEPDVLRRCLPGCESVERVSDVEFALRMRISPAAAGAPLKGALRLEDVDPPAGFRFTAELRSENGGAVAAEGRVHLAAAGETTLLRYELTLGGDALPGRDPGGPGEELAGRLAEAFLLRLERALAERRGAASAPVSPPQAPAATFREEPRPGLRPAVWVPALMLAVALILYSSS